MKRPTSNKLVGCLGAAIMLAIFVAPIVGIAILLEHFFPPVPPKPGSFDREPRDRVVPILNVARVLLFVAILVVAAIARGASRIRALAKVRRWQRNECVKCGYSMVGNVSGACPECGKTLQAPTEKQFEIAQGRPYSERMQFVFGAAFLALGVLALIVSIVDPHARIWGAVITALGLIVMFSGVIGG